MRNFFNSIIDIYAQIYCRIWTCYIRNGWGESTADKAALILMSFSIYGNTIFIASVLTFGFRMMGYNYSKFIYQSTLALAVLAVLFVIFKFGTKGMIKRFNKIPKENLKSPWFLWIYGILNFSLAFLIAWLQGKYLGK